jgi:DNA-binding IclR family transcriptional regulator
MLGFFGVPIARSYLPQQDNLRVSPYGMHLGNRLPAHATSTGKVLLAALPEDTSLSSNTTIEKVRDVCAHKRFKND